MTTTITMTAEEDIRGNSLVMLGLEGTVREHNGNPSQSVFGVVESPANAGDTVSIITSGRATVRRHGSIPMTPGIPVIAAGELRGDGNAANGSITNFLFEPAPGNRQYGVGIVLEDVGDGEQLVDLALQLSALPAWVAP